MSEPSVSYKGVTIPKRLQRYYLKTSGRWWRNGIDAAQVHLIALLTERIAHLEQQETFTTYQEDMRQGRLAELESMIGGFRGLQIVKNG
jgi:hypothetical protein